MFSIQPLQVSAIESVSGGGYEIVLTEDHQEYAVRVLDLDEFRDWDAFRRNVLKNTTIGRGFWNQTVADEPEIVGLWRARADETLRRFGLG